MGTDVGEDVLVYENSIVGPEVTLGDGSVVFMRAVVGHESTVGRGCVLAAGSILNARVMLEDEVYVGTNASILPEVRVGRGATIGSNTVVIQDVPAAATVMGVPGAILETKPLTVLSELRDSVSVRETEGAILAIWRDALQRPELTLDENFFDAGGTSLLALRALPRIRAATGCELVAIDLFQFPNVRRLAALVSSRLHGGESGARLNRADLRRGLRARRRDARFVDGR